MAEENNQMSLYSQIDSIYPHLTKSERKAADFIVRHFDDLASMTLASMAKKANVGEATMMRFIYKLNFDSLAQFKLGVVKEIVQEQPSSKCEDTAQDYADRIHDLMSDTIRVNAEEDITRAAEMIDQADHVYFFGNGTSGFAAEAASYRFFRGGLSCEAVTDVHYMTMKSTVLKKSDLIIAVSQSGDNLDLISACKRANKRHVPIVTITGHQLSPLSQLGDLNLFHAPVSFVDKSYYGGFVGIMIQEFIAELIFMAYSRKHPDQVEEYQRATTVSTDLHHAGLINRTKDD